MESESRRRKQVRVKVGHPVKCLSSHIIFDGRAKDLSINGLCLYSPVKLEPGMEVALSFYTSPQGDPPVLVLGRVVWSAKDGPDRPDRENLLGLSFLQLTPEKQDLLERHIQRILHAGPAYNA